MSKVTKEEFEAFKASVMKEIGISQDGLLRLNRAHETIINRVSELSPNIAELRAKDTVISQISKELEEQAVRNIELRTKNNNLVRDQSKYTEFLKKEGLEDQFFKFYKK